MPTPSTPVWTSPADGATVTGIAYLAWEPSTIPPAPPVVQITTVPDGTTVSLSVDGGITLGGVAHDPNDGRLPPSALAWSSSLDGPLGTSAPYGYLVVTDFSLGEHVITLTATDFDGDTATATVTITVVE